MRKRISEIKRVNIKKMKEEKKLLLKLIDLLISKGLITEKEIRKVV